MVVKYVMYHKQLLEWHIVMMGFCSSLVVVLLLGCVENNPTRITIIRQGLFTMHYICQLPV